MSTSIRPPWRTAASMPGLPQSLRSQFMLGIAALSVLIVAIGMAAIFSLRNASDATQQLAQQQLAHAEKAQHIAMLVRSAERQLERMLSDPGAGAPAASRDGDHGLPSDPLQRLENLLTQEDLDGEGVPHAGLLHGTRQLRDELERLRTLQGQAAVGLADPTGVAAQRHAVAQRAEVLAAAALRHVADHEKAYRGTLDALLAHSVGNQRGIVLLLVIALLFTWMVASLFLGRHLLLRLQAVSRHLRGDDARATPLAELAQGPDEIADMARAVEALLADREALQGRTAQLCQTQETLTEQGRILEMVASREALPAVLERLVATTEARLPGLRVAILLPEDANILPPGLHPVWAEPIRAHDDQVLGSLATCAPQARHAQEPERLIIQAAARLAGIAIERQRSEQRIRHMAHHDELTGLPNRALLNDRLAQALAQARRTHCPLAVLFLDLDGFKDINDSLGHPVGDRLLQSVADRLRTLVRDGDTVARLGGDEFVVMLLNLVQVSDAVAVARSIAAALACEYRVEDHRLHITVSIGVAACPDDGDSPEVLLKHADAAMYRAKARGRNGVQTYTHDMSVHARQRLELHAALRHALDAGQFELHYQPQLDLASGRLRGVEALLRWQHPKLGMVSPDRFIPLAEETGLIAPLGQWVLETAVAQLRRWRAAGHTQLAMAVNLSARQVEAAGLPALVRQVLQDHGVPARWLELEMTETALLHHGETALATLQGLKDLGVALALDDFGTGYSSLSHLRRFPIDTIKIDKSFTAEIGTSEDTTAIIRAIVALARSLEVETVAEGVETEAQLRLLAQLGCHHAQGYHLSRPVPAAAIEALLCLGPIDGHAPATGTVEAAALAAAA